MANTFDLTEVSNMFKETYDKVCTNVYNSANVTLARVKKSYAFEGKQKMIPIPQGFAGGVGSGSLPTANNPSVEDAIITAKKVYGVVRIDREAIKASASDKGSFVRGLKYVAQKGVESYTRNVSRILFNSLDNGQVAVDDNSTNVSGAGTSGSPYVVVLASTTKESDIEEGDHWNCGAETTLLEVSSYEHSTKTVNLIGTSALLAAASGSAPVNSKFYMQGSKDNDPESLGSVLSATAGSVYSVPVTRRWKAGVYEDASSAGLTTDMMNDDMLTIQRKCGKAPKMIICGYTQYKKILNMLEDKKEYKLDPRAKNLKGLISFRGVAFDSANGPIPVFPERFVEEDAIYYLNDDEIEILHRPDHGWFDDDGTVFLRVSDADAYEARYGGYFQIFIKPNFHGKRYGLAT